MSVSPFLLFFIIVLAHPSAVPFSLPSSWCTRCFILPPSLTVAVEHSRVNYIYSSGSNIGGAAFGLVEWFIFVLDATLFRIVAIRSTNHEITIKSALLLQRTTWRVNSLRTPKCSLRVCPHLGVLINFRSSFSQRLSYVSLFQSYWIHGAIFCTGKLPFVIQSTRIKPIQLRVSLFNFF